MNLLCYVLVSNRLPLHALFMFAWHIAERAFFFPWRSPHAVLLFVCMVREFCLLAARVMFAWCALLCGEVFCAHCFCGSDDLGATELGNGRDGPGAGGLGAKTSEAWRQQTQDDFLCETVTEFRRTSISLLEEVHAYKTEY
jgi:hypothetical protein